MTSDPRPVRMFSALAAAFALLVGGLGLAACGGGQTRSAVFVVIDETDSYVEFARETLPIDLNLLTNQCVQEECYLLVDGLTESSLRTGRLPVNRELVIPESQADGGALERQAQETLVAQVLTDIQSNLHLGTEGECSDVIGALRAAVNALATHPELDPSIVMFSDGMTNCESFDLREIDRSQTGIDAAVDDLDRSGAIPDMDGITLRIVGGGAMQSRVTPEEIHAFWEAFLARAGAELPSDWWSIRYAATSPA